MTAHRYTRMTSEEYRRQLKDGLNVVFGLEETENTRYKACERYTNGWQDPFLLLNAYHPEPEPLPITIDAPVFKIRWWHRVIYFFYKLARRCL
jgi:hypothetical protein